MFLDRHCGILNGGLDSSFPKLADEFTFFNYLELLLWIENLNFRLKERDESPQQKPKRSERPFLHNLVSI